MKSQGTLGLRQDTTRSGKSSVTATSGRRETASLGWFIPRQMSATVKLPFPPKDLELKVIFSVEAEAKRVLNNPKEMFKFENLQNSS